MSEEKATETGYEDAGTEVAEEEASTTEEPFDIHTLARATSEMGVEEDDGKGEKQEEGGEEPDDNNLLPEEFYKLNVKFQEDGKEVIKPLSEAIKSGMRERNFTQKTMEISNIKAIADVLTQHPELQEMWLKQMRAIKRGEKPGWDAPESEQKKQEVEKITLPDNFEQYDMPPEMRESMKELVDTVNKQNETIGELQGTRQQVEQIQETQQLTAEQRQAGIELNDKIQEARQHVSEILGVEIDPKDFHDKLGTYFDDEGYGFQDLHDNRSVPQWVILHAERAYRDDISNRHLEEYKTQVSKRSPKRPTSKTPLRSTGTSQSTTTKVAFEVDEFGKSKDPKQVTRELAKLSNIPRSQEER